MRPETVFTVDSRILLTLTAFELSVDFYFEHGLNKIVNIYFQALFSIEYLNYTTIDSADNGFGKLEKKHTHTNTHTH